MILLIHLEVHHLMEYYAILCNIHGTFMGSSTKKTRNSPGNHDQLQVLTGFP